MDFAPWRSDWKFNSSVGSFIWAGCLLITLIIVISIKTVRVSGYYRVRIPRSKRNGSTSVAFVAFGKKRPHCTIKPFDLNADSDIFNWKTCTPVAYNPIRQFINEWMPFRRRLIRTPNDTDNYFIVCIWKSYRKDCLRYVCAGVPPLHD